MTSKVYVVEGATPYEGGAIQGVFSKLEIAEKVAATLRKQKPTLWEDYFVDEYELDEPHSD